MRHLAIICAFELISLTGHLVSAQHQENARCLTGVENGSCTATRLELQISQDVEAKFLYKEKIPCPQRKPFKISTYSKAYVSFFLFSWGSRRDTEADVVHSDRAAYVNSILLSHSFG